MYKAKFIPIAEEESYRLRMMASICNPCFKGDNVLSGTIVLFSNDEVARHLHNKLSGLNENFPVFFEMKEDTSQLKKMDFIEGNHWDVWVRFAKDDEEWRVIISPHDKLIMREQSIRWYQKVQDLSKGETL